MRSVAILCRAAAEILAAHDVTLPEEAQAAEVLALVLRVIKPMAIRQHTEPVAPALLDREESGFWHETPANCPPKPETIAKAMAAVPPPPAGVD